MVRTVSNAIARLDRQISQHQHTLARVQKRLPALMSQKEGLLKLKDKYPNAKYEGSAIHIETVDWTNIAGVSIDRHRGRDVLTYTVKFSLNKKNSDGVKVFMTPVENKIAETPQYYRLVNINKPNEIKIFDYKNIIPESCPRRKVLTKQIKKYLLKTIRSRKLNISNDSFDKEDFLKLMVLT